MSATKSPVKHPLSYLLEHGKPKGTAVVGGLRDFLFEIRGAVVGAENDCEERLDDR